MDRTSDHRLAVLIAHAEPLLTASLVAVLREHDEIDVFVQDELRALHTGRPVDVVVTDYQGGLRHAAEARCCALPRHLAAARVMVLTMSNREHEIRVALEHGVHGYLVLGCQIDEISAGVRQVGRGSRYLCRSAAQSMAEGLARDALTVREGQVLRLLARGKCNKAIGRDLEIAIGTVKAHVKAIMGKLDARSRTQAACIASRRGLVDGMGADPAWNSPFPAAHTGRADAGAAHDA
jgi:DNA-binding NarL/FixJ family response regulator